MKKLIAIIAILAFATTVFATESDPSETVGFVKIDADVGYTSFGLPFTFYDALHAQTMALDDIIGAQFTGSPIPPQSDQLIDMNTGAFATYNPGTLTWVGALTTVTPGHTYYVFVRSGHTPFDWTYDPTGAKASKSTNVIKVKANKR